MTKNATAEEIHDLFRILLHREPREEELIYHRDKPIFEKRNEFLNCIEFSYHRQPLAKRVAILICGQLRNVEFCLDSFMEHVIAPNQASTEFHLFIATQDCISIKPRLGCGLINQYFVYPINAQKLLQLYTQKFSICKTNVRDCYQQLIANQLPNMQLNMVGWAETFWDLQIAIEMALAYEKENNIKYDLFIRTRPDFIYTKPLLCHQLPLFTCAKSFMDCFFLMDVECVQRMVGFYLYYTQLLTRQKIQEFQQNGTWDVTFICEVQLDEYLKQNKINILQQHVEDQGMPLSWFISHIKDQQPIMLSKEWQEKLNLFVDRLVPCIFDLY